ncbi:beta-mannanase [Streptomyces clavuligerus]|nr:beta-mannanase [Streptomyces clavuligerus]AXU14266.1 beta-mannanase [Streptomyces clavuligerus]EDY48194.1 glycoside hydrolase [Streptomyces clavuligerus]MBY6304268.1 beta-mannanase [Streptomyces clavuligerus]QCS07040.1 beta-mannanase [Streptomyces clavuligerus]
MLPVCLMTLLTGCSEGDGGAPKGRSGDDGPPPAPVSANSLAAERLIPERGVYFGISTLRTPFAPEETDLVAEKAGVRPNLLEYFVKWNEEYRPQAVDAAYEQTAVPLLTWEPWASKEAGTEQPEYALARITEGRHDPYIRRFAEDIRVHGRPLILRFAHEMNSTWFPWAEGRNGNRPGEYVRAWRHVHDVFTEAGADNVVWHWSPNILRTVEEVRLRPLYPGDQYVDLVGVTGYRRHEKTAGAVLDPALNEIRRITRRPILIAETGAKPGVEKAGWIADFFRWLDRNPDVVGFVWFERDTVQGGKQDWRFAETPGTQRAFRGGLEWVELARVPDGEPIRVGDSDLGESDRERSGLGRST